MICLSMCTLVGMVSLSRINDGRLYDFSLSEYTPQRSMDGVRLSRDRERERMGFSPRDVDKKVHASVSVEEPHHQIEYGERESDRERVREHPWFVGVAMRENVPMPLSWPSFTSLDQTIVYFYDTTRCFSPRRKPPICLSHLRP